MSRSTRRLSAAVKSLLFAFSMLLVVPESHAIDFNFTYDDVNSDPPAFDPNGDALLAMFVASESLWADIIEDDWDIDISFYWDDTINPNFSGLNSPTATSDGRVTAATITMNPNRQWWVDPTPFDNSEYDIAQTLYRDLSSAQQSAWFGGNTPDLLEVGFTGTPSASAPAIVQNPNTRDLLTVAVHELGHSLGIASNSEITTDGDYDINPDFVNGAIFDAFTESTSNGHLNPSSQSGSQVLMCRCSLAGRRRLPSALDALAGASAVGWEEIDLQRQDFLGGADWNTDFNWEGNAVPGSFDAAFVRTGTGITLSGNGFVRTLLIDETSNVNTQSNSLQAFDSITVQDQTGSLSFLTIPNGGSALTDVATIGDGGRVIVLSGGTLDANRVIVSSGGAIVGSGLVNVSDEIGTLVNDGQIMAIAGGTLTFDSPNNIPFDLDGDNGNGVIEASNGNLVFHDGASDSFNSRATVGAGHSITFNAGISIGSGGELHMNGGANSIAIVDGFVNLENGSVISARGRANINGALVMASGSTITSSNSDYDLRLNGQTLFQGGELAGSGVARQVGNAFVQQDTTISVDVYDMDGLLAAASSITIEAGRTLTIESNSLEAGNDGYDGTMNIDGGTVDIDAAWALDGTINFDDNGGNTATLTGAGGLTTEIGSQINVTGDTLVTTDLVATGGSFLIDDVAEFTGDKLLGAAASFNVDDPGDQLILGGVTTILGSSVVGGGELVLEGVVNVPLIDTSIGVADVDLDGNQGTTEINIGTDVRLSIVSEISDSANGDGFDGAINNRGQLSVIAGWRLDGVLNLNPPSEPATVEGLGPFELHSGGTINSSGNSRIEADTVLHGAVNVTGETLFLNGTTTFSETAIVQVSSGAEIEWNDATEIAGASFNGEGDVSFDATTTVSRNTVMNVRRADLDGFSDDTHVILESQLELNVNSVDINQSFGGNFDGVLDINGLTAGLTVNFPSSFTSWRMDGTLNISNVGLIPQYSLRGSRVFMDGTMNVTGLSNVESDLILRGTINTSNSFSSLRLVNGSESVIWSQASFNGPGDIWVISGSTLNIQTLSIVGLDVTNAARIEPGLMTIGDVMIDGDYTQEARGTLAFQLRGAQNANMTDQDVLRVSGTAALDGTLEVELITGFVPSEGSVYTLLLADSIEGTFADTIFLSDSAYRFTATPFVTAIRAGITIDEVFLFGDFDDNDSHTCNDIDELVAQIASGIFDSAYDLDENLVVDGDDLQLWLEIAGVHTVGSPFVAGDANLDGHVDGLDFDIWSANKFTSSPAWCQGDFDADGQIGAHDFLIWNANRSNVPVAVPEPNVCFLALLWLIGSTFRGMSHTPESYG